MSDDDQEEDDDEDDGEKDSLSLLARNDSHRKKSLEALLQVTKSELKRMKCSRDDVEEEDLDDGDDVSSEVEPQADEIKSGVAVARAHHRSPLCGLDCGRSNVLRKHIRRTHHASERPHQCVPCGFAFKTKSNLYKHCKSRAHQQCSTTASAAMSNDEGEEDDELLQWGENDETEDNDSLASDFSEPRHGRVASNTALEMKALPSSSTPVVVAASTSTTTSIYKPKFHLTAHTPTPTSSNGSTTEVRPLTPPPDSSAVFSPPPAHSSYTAFLPTSSYVENEERNQNNEDAPITNRTKRSLAKRRHESFRLRLEIPEAFALQRRSDVEPPLPPPSCSDPLDAGGNLTGSLKSPMASPEFLQQHISKLISQNAAIVDTLNPLWPRRYARQSSSGGGGGSSSSILSTNRVLHPANDPHGGEAGLKSPALNKKRIRRVDEVVVPQSSSSSNCASESASSSHLARALLANNDDSFCASSRTHLANAPPSPLHNTFSSSSSVLRSTDASKNSSTSASSFTYRGCSALHSPSSNDDDDDDDKDNDVDHNEHHVEDVQPNDTRRSNIENTSNAGRDPQNPEGSIIKDLLLKARSSSATVQSSSSCVRLSGGSISVVHLPQLHGECTIKDDDSSSQFLCHVCQQATFRSAENLEIHQAHYCLQRVSATSISAAPASSSEEFASRRRTFHHIQKSSPSSLMSVGSGGGGVGVKPRGRPKGSKNRPKVDVQMTMGKSRVHSKSLCEYSSSQDDSMTTTTLDFRSRTGAGTAPGPAPAKFSYRRNSVSGVPSSESIKDILTSSFQLEQGIASGGGADGLLVTTEGPILKKHLLLGGDRSPPLKKRKIPVNVEWCASSSSSESTKNRVVTTTFTTATTTTSTSSLKSLEHLSRHPMPRPNSSSSSSVCLFGGEVQVYDAYVPETKTISVDVDSKVKPAVLKTALEKNNEDGDDISERDEDASSSVVATIAKPVHNSGGVLLQVCDRKATDNSLKSATSQLVSAAVGRPLMATGRSDTRCGRSTTTFANLSGATVLSPHRTTPSREFSIDISHLNLKAMTTAVDNVVKISRSDDFGLMSEETLKKMERIRQSEVPSIAVHSPPNSPLKDEQEDEINEAADGQKETKHLHALQRPTSLLLNSSTIRHSSMVGTTLVSPETPRPEKKYGQCYINGQYYTYLELKHSTRVYYCCIGRPQPMYVPQSTDPKLSMYSVWQTVPQDPDSISPVQALGLYNSRPHCPYTVAAPAETPLQTTHSSYWKFRQQNTESSSAKQRNDENKDGVAGWPERMLERKLHSSKEMETRRRDRNRSSNSIGRVDGDEDDSNVDDGFVDSGATPSDDGVLHQKTSSSHSSNAVASSSIGCFVDAGDELHRVRIFEGGFKSNESYTYVRGRGRGKYVCEDCGIRCKKPSMLKKHVRTHTDLRPYACNHCSFSFKTKGNLTKHMKSKAHHKKCTEMGIIPVPVSIDDVQIDEEALARQERIEHQRRQFANDDDDSDIDDDEDDDYDDDECEGDDFMMTTMQSYEDGDDSLEEGQFEDADRVEGLPTRTRMGAEYFSGNSPTPEQEVIAQSLLDLGRPDSSAQRLLDQSSRLGIEKFEEVALARPLTPHGPLLRDRESDEEPLSIDQPMDLSMPHSRAVDGEEAKDEEGDIADGYVSYSPDQLKSYDDHAAKGNPDLQTHHRDRRSPYSTSGGLLQSYLLSDKGKETEVVVHARSRYDEAGQRHHHSVDFNAGGDDIKPQSSVPGCPSSSSYRYSTTQVPTSTNAASQPHGHHRNLGNRASLEVAESTAASGLSPTSSLAGVRRVSSSSSSAAFVQRPMDQGEGKCVCNICNKMFTRPSQLRLHVNIHYFERPFRCESCAISFRTKGHLQKHKRSISHYNKVNMNLAFGTPSTDNPRPFKCGDCKIAFRIHGHLAKHLRSKMHIMKLECLGKLPFGTYAEIERSGASLNEIDTSDCDNSLESLQTMAMRLVDKDGLANASTSSAAAAAVTAAANARQLWPRERTISGGSIGDDQSDGVPYVESQDELNPAPHNQHAHSQGHSGTSSRLYVVDRGSNGGRAGGDSPDMTEVGGLVKWSQKAAIIAPHIKSAADVKHEVVNSSSAERTGVSSASSSSPRRSASVKVVVMVERDLHGDEDESPGDYGATRNYYTSRGGVVSAGSGVGDGGGQYGIEDISADEDEELEAMDSSMSKDVTSTTPAGVSAAAGPYCRPVCQSPRMMMMTSQPASVSTWKDSSETGSVFVRECDLCGEIFHNAHTLKQHLLVHSRLRPFVCDWCDAGFTTAHLLNVHHHEVHNRQHEDYKEIVCTRCGQSFASSVDLKCHQLECLQSSSSSSPPKLFTSTTTTVKPRDPGADLFGRDPT